MARKVREGRLKGGLPYMTFGEGPPLVVFPGLGMSNENPTGIQRFGEVRLLSPLARAFTVHRVSRRVGLEHGTTMRNLADDYAPALESGFGRAVDVLGISTGGSIALQLAADRPGLVGRPDVTDSPLGRKIAGGLLWLAGPLFIRRRWDPSAMIATIEAEDAFEVGKKARGDPCANPSHRGWPRPVLSSRALQGDRGSDP